MNFFSIFKRNPRPLSPLNEFISTLNPEVIQRDFISENNFRRDLSSVISDHVLILTNVFFLRIKDIFEKPGFANSKLDSLWAPPPFSNQIDFEADERNLREVLKNSYDVIIFEAAAYFFHYLMRDYKKKEAELDEEGDVDSATYFNSDPYYSAIKAALFKTGRIFDGKTSLKADKKKLWIRSDSYSPIWFDFHKDKSETQKPISIEQEGSLFLKF